MRRFAIATALCIAGAGAVALACDEYQKADARVLKVDSTGGCPVEAAATNLVAALKVMDTEAAGRTEIIAALKSLSKLSPDAKQGIVAMVTEAGITCDSPCSSMRNVAKIDAPKTCGVQVAKIDAPKTCGVQVAKIDAPKTCGAQVAKIDAPKTCGVQVAKIDAPKTCGVQVAKIDAPKTCGVQVAKIDAPKTCGAQVAKVDGATCASTCSKSRLSGVAQVASADCAAKTACSDRYVAFGCSKSDRIARAAARAYLDMLAEVKNISGAEGCSAECAREVLVAVLNEMTDERTATRAKIDVEVKPVSLGAVSSGSGCCSKGKNAR